MYRNIRLKHSAFPWRVTKIGFRTCSGAFFCAFVTHHTTRLGGHSKQFSFQARKDTTFPRRRVPRRIPGGLATDSRTGSYIFPSCAERYPDSGAEKAPLVMGTNYCNSLSTVGVPIRHSKRDWCGQPDHFCWICHTNP